jgi:hypothetical protein
MVFSSFLRRERDAFARKKASKGGAVIISDKGVRGSS